MSELKPNTQEAQGSQKIEVRTSIDQKHNSEKLAKRAEKAAEKAKNSTEKARAETQEALAAAEESSEDQSNSVDEKDNRKAAMISPAEKVVAYRETIKHIQKQMSLPSRSFSKLIHNPSIEKLSETGSKTIARPSGLIGGGAAIILGLSVSYYSARKSGFELSGSEFIFLLLAGFLMGIVSEWIVRAVKKSVQI